MTEREIIEKEIQESQVEILSLKNFLASKDYQTIREMQGGEAMDRETKDACAKARLRINNLEEIVRTDEERLSNLPEEEPREGDTE